LPEKYKLIVTETILGKSENFTAYFIIDADASFTLSCVSDSINYVQPINGFSENQYGFCQTGVTATFDQNSIQTPIV